MKLLIASDIHGSAHWAKKVVEAFQFENPDKLILLGDLLYHGPRNDLPDDYAPKKVIPMLNYLKDKILCVRGNCDAEVDQMVLEFPIMADCLPLFLDGRQIFCTHGHIYHTGNPPKLSAGDILLHGHTHLQVMEQQPEGYWYLNPGSASIPKGGTCHSYMTYENGLFAIKNLETHETVQQHQF